MIYATQRTRDDGTTYTEFKGLSIDAKPVSATVGDIFIEIDSCSSYKFTNSGWDYIETITEAGGGGGGDGYTHIVVTNPTFQAQEQRGDFYFYTAILTIDGEQVAVSDIIERATENGEKFVVDINEDLMISEDEDIGYSVISYNSPLEFRGVYEDGETEYSQFTSVLLHGERLDGTPLVELLCADFGGAMGMTLVYMFTRVELHPGYYIAWENSDPEDAFPETTIELDELVEGEPYDYIMIEFNSDSPSISMPLKEGAQCAATSFSWISNSNTIAFRYIDIIDSTHVKIGKCDYKGIGGSTTSGTSNTNMIPFRIYGYYLHSEDF